MTNPLNQPITVPFRGKTYDCDLQLGALAAVEGELGVGILCPDAKSLWTRPEFYQRAVLLYCLLRSKPKLSFSFDQCCEEIVGPNAVRLGELLATAAERLQPEILRINGISLPEEKQASPLADESGGLGSGQVQNSGSISASASSGA